MPFLHSRSIDWSVPTAVYAVWAMRKCTTALAEGVRDALSRIQSAFHMSVSHTHGCFVSVVSPLRTRQGGLSNCHLDPFGIVIPSTHFKSIIVNSPNHHAKECAND